MKKFVMLAAVLAALIPVAQAQGAKGQIFGGFSILSVGDDGDRETLYGWQARVSGNVSPMLAIAGDIGGHYKKNGSERIKAHEFLFGPQINIPGEKGSGFIHFLVGGVRAGGGGESATGLALGIGGGADINVGERAAFRIIQFDWLPNRFNGEWSKDAVRLGFGIVYNFGG